MVAVCQIRFSIVGLFKSYSPGSGKDQNRVLRMWNVSNAVGGSFTLVYYRKLM